VNTERGFKMSSRYSERDYGRGYDYDYERGSMGRGREGRGIVERAGDEVRSWLGDDEAERRRKMDERYGSGGYGNEYGRYGRESSSGRYMTGYGAGSVGERGFGENAILVRLSDTDFDIPDDQDIRGRRIADQDRNEIGKINDLLIDPRERRVRFLQVTSGGVLGIGGTMLLVPVEAITRIDREMVEISRSGRGFGSMRYNPMLIDRRGTGGGFWGSAGGYMTTGRHRGRGPRGYKRSDDRIREDVNDRLSDDPLLDASGIDVVVNDGVVTLSGTVNDRTDKRRAEDITLMVPGVTDVLVSLAVLPLTTETTTGTTTSRTAAGAAAGMSGTTGSRTRSTTT
jgi:osmotically-inducible protein OsmY/sporulation protein YlmC with PRC-barrel domain